MKKYILNLIKIIVLFSVFLTTLHINNTIFATSQEGQTIEDGVYVIKSALNEKFVFDITSSSKEDGGNLELWTNGGTNNQKFTIKYVGDGCYTMSPVHSGKYIDVEHNSKNQGANVLQWEYHGGNNQKWMIKDAGNGYYNIVSKSNGLYLDIPQSNSKDGANVQVWEKNGAKNQQFKFEKQVADNYPQGTKTIDDGIYLIKSAANAKNVLDVGGSSMKDGANIGIWENGSTANQKFKVKHIGNGYYTLSLAHSGKYMDIEGSSKKDGANVLQWEYHGGNNQQWVIKDAGDGYYYIVSKCNGFYLTADGSNANTQKANNSNNQKFKFEKPTELKGEQTIADGTYVIASALNIQNVLDIPGSSKKDGETLTIWRNGLTSNQKFEVKYIGNGYYTIKVQHSGKAIEVAGGSTLLNTKVQQNTVNSSDAQKWIIKDAGEGYYNIISKCSELYLEVTDGNSTPGTKMQVYNKNNSDSQKFQFRDPNTLIDIDNSKYPGYKEKIEKLMLAHPDWNFKLLYTGLNFDEAVSGEAAVHSRNLVETNHRGEWVCPTCGTKLYDSGWYCASEKAIAYYLDPRNFLDEINVFQFQDVNQYPDACTLDGIRVKVKGSFLENYADDIERATRNKNVNPYYIIARLFQEQGKNGTTIGKGMNGGDGKTYYNPFNIGASGDGYDQIYANALATAKRYGWDTMQKAIEGGINFCKENWLENYQNTLYQNRFDIDSTNGTSLYTHQYMQNLMGAYSEARTLQSIYEMTGKIDSNFTFIIPLYENMDKQLSPLPSDNTEAYPINVETTGTKINLRAEPNTNSKIIKEIPEQGTILLSIERGINSDWQKVVTSDGQFGYISGKFLKQVKDVTTCNYKARVKTNDGQGCNTRLGPSTQTARVRALEENTEITVIDNSTYKNIDGLNWYRIILSDGTQAFISSAYVK